MEFEIIDNGELLTAVACLVATFIASNKTEGTGPLGDVYKRQIDLTFQLVNSEFILPKACCIKFKRMYSRVRPIFDAVSYTHLDVYKRQSITFGTVWCQ